MTCDRYDVAFEAVGAPVALASRVLITFLGMVLDTARPLQGPHRKPHLTVRAGTVLAQVDVMGRHLRIILNVIPWAGSNFSWLSPPVARCRR
jgi:hypothetical protein